MAERRHKCKTCSRLVKPSETYCWECVYHYVDIKDQRKEKETKRDGETAQMSVRGG